MNTYIITGGTGKTGKLISLGLLENGHKVRVVCRDAQRAQELKEKGAEIFTGGTRDEIFLEKAFAGCDAAYILLPIDMQAEDYTAMQVAHATALRNAVIRADIKKVVTLSSVGAHLDSGNGVVLGLHKMEELFNEVPNLDVKHVRATYFMENTLRQIPLIKSKGLMAGPEAGDVKFAMTASKDIAATALKHLQTLKFTGKSIDYILGERDLSYDEIAEIYGQAIGQPDLEYHQISKTEFLSGMQEIGAGESAAKKFYEFTELINTGRVPRFYKRNSKNTTPTSIEEFALTFKKEFDL